MSDKIKIDNNNFYNMENWEMNEILSTTHYNYYGLTLQQHPTAIRKLDQLLHFGDFARIIEIGTGDGGLSILFAIWAKISKKEFYSFDIHDKGANIELLRTLTDNFEVKDVLFNEQNVEYVKNLIQQSGRTLLICDAGKIVDFNIYSDHLKSGDFIMMHDFAPTKEDFETRVKGRIWNWHESWYSGVEDKAQQNNIIFTDYFEDCVWSCGRKQ